MEDAATSATSCACIVAGMNPRPLAEPTAVIEVLGAFATIVLAFSCLVLKSRL